MRFSITPAGAQNEAAAFLSASEIMHRADSVSTYQDTLLAHTKFKAREEVIFNEIGGKGEIKNSDTVISLVTMEGKRRISRQIVYSSRKKEGEKQGESQEAGMEFSYSNPDYNYSLTETNATSFIIAVSPKAEPKKGDVRGTISIDRQGFFTRALNLEVPKPEGALKEFATQISFEPLEGGLVVHAGDEDERFRQGAPWHLQNALLRRNPLLRLRNFEVKSFHRHKANLSRRDRSRLFCCQAALQRGSPYGP